MDAKIESYKVLFCFILSLTGTQCLSLFAFLLRAAIISSESHGLEIPPGESLRWIDVSSARTYNYLQVIETLIRNGPWCCCDIDVKSYSGIYGNCNNRDNGGDVQARWDGLYLHPRWTVTLLAFYACCCCFSVDNSCTLFYCGLYFYAHFLFLSFKWSW